MSQDPGRGSPADSFTGSEPGGRSPAADCAARLLATAGGLGYAPVAPGTVASLPPALLVWGLRPSDTWLVALLFGVALVGVWAAGREERRAGVVDPPSVVIDEVAGMLVALVGQPRTLGWVVGLFLLFRVMDVWKPAPVRQLEALPGGFGIVVDDLVAGAYANLAGRLAHWLIA